ncbi:MAG: hypothetical protein RL885_10205 [Planctomycetota bacterium]
MTRLLRLALPCLLLLLAESAAAQAIEDPGPHAVGWRDVSFVDANFGRGTVTGRIYYPATSAGQNRPADPANGPYPLSGFMHGFLGSPPFYDNICTHAASWGFVVASIGTETGFNATMQNEAADTRALLHWVNDQSGTPGAWLAGMVGAGDWSASGHSMGGGACMYLIGLEPKVRVIVPLEPYRGTALGGYVGSRNNVRNFTGVMHCIAGSVDTTVPPRTMVYQYYRDGFVASRNFFNEVTGMGHGGPTDFPPNDEPLSGAEQHRLHRRLLTGTLRAELLGEEDLYRDLFGDGAAGEPLVLESDCDEPPLWVLQTGTSPRQVGIGLAGNTTDAVAFGVSLLPASINTPFGVLGLDPGVGFVFYQAPLPATGAVEVSAPIPSVLVGQTLYFQGLSIPGGSFSRATDLLIQ